MTLRLRENFIAFKTIFNKEIYRFARLWIQTIVPPAITTTLYFIIFGELLGANIQPIHGYKYIDYIIPGLIMLSVINNAYANVVSSFFGAKFQRHIEELLVSPASPFVILLGFTCGGIARGMAVGAVVTCIAYFFSPIRIVHPGLMILITLMTALLFSLGGLINAIFAKKFDDTNIVPTFILLPLTYLGGIFYSIEFLPDVWKQISLANPILYMINAFRYSWLGTSDVSIAAALSIVGVLLAFLFVWAWFLLQKGIGIKQ